MYSVVSKATKRKLSCYVVVFNWSAVMCRMETPRSHCFNKCLRNGLADTSKSDRKLTLNDFFLTSMYLRQKWTREVVKVSKLFTGQIRVRVKSY